MTNEINTLKQELDEIKQLLKKLPMAIREVLVSFTFEQQRQMINLIGADVGDVAH
jgi:phosphoglycerate-specific signal transduction histidine kinase